MVNFVLERIMDHGADHDQGWYFLSQPGGSLLLVAKKPNAVCALVHDA